VTLGLDDGMGDVVPFDIDGDGTVTISGVVDFETQEYYTLQVTATDQDGNQAFATVAVSLNDINENPVFSPDAYDFVVGEEVPIGTSVGTVNVIDPEGASLTLTVDDGMGSSVPFAVDSDGTITTAGPLDFELQSFYVLQVTATDASNNSATASVDVHVNSAAFAGALSLWLEAEEDNPLIEISESISIDGNRSHPILPTGCAL